MWLVYAVASALLFGLAGLWMKASQMGRGSTDFMLLGLYVSGMAGFGVHAWAEGTLAELVRDWRIAAAGAIIGAGSAWGNAIFMKALEYGPASLTSPLTNMNIVLVIAMAITIYGEPLGTLEGIGVLMLLIAVMLVSYKGKEPLAVREKKWFALIAFSIILFAIRNGGLKVTGELELASAPILFTGYALSALWFAVPAWRLAVRQRRQPHTAASQPGTQPAEWQPAVQHGAERQGAASFHVGWRWGLLAGLFSYGGLQLYAIALLTGKANIVAPLFATNGLVVAAGAILLFKERLTIQQSVALACAIAGLILVRL